MIDVLTHRAILAQAAPASQGWFTGLEANYRFVITLAVIGCATAIVISIVVNVCALVGNMHRERLQAELKQDLLDRGLSADDIVRVTESRAPENLLDRWASHRGRRDCTS